jgi:hypothetical protein
MPTTKKPYTIKIKEEREPFIVWAENAEYAIILLQAKTIETYGKTYTIEKVGN